MQGEELGTNYKAILPLAVAALPLTSAAKPLETSDAGK